MSHPSNTPPVANKRVVVLPLLLTGVTASLFILFWGWGAWFTHLPYDETLFHGLVREIQRSGWPTRPSGELYLVNQPLTLYVQAWLTSFLPTSFMTFFWARLIHALLYVIPLIVITAVAAHRLYGRNSAIAVPAIFLSLEFFVNEAIPAELDIPFTFAYTCTFVLLWAHWQCHDEIRAKRLIWWIGFSTAICLWIKLFQGLVLLPSVATYLVVRYGYHPRAWSAFLIRFLSPLVLAVTAWVFWASLFGANALDKLLFLSKAVTVGDEKYRHVSGGKSVITFPLFLASHVSLPLFVAVFYSLRVFWHDRKRWVLPAICVAWVLIAILSGKIRVVRYFDPAIPAMVLLFSALFSGQGQTVKRSAWLSALGAFVGVLGVRFFVDGVLVIGSFEVEFFKLFFLAMTAVLIFFPIGREGRWQPVTPLALFLLANVFLFSWSNFPIWQHDAAERTSWKHAFVAGDEFRQLLPEDAQVATTNMTTAFALDRNTFHLQSKYPQLSLTAVTQGPWPYLALNPENDLVGDFGKKLAVIVSQDYQPLAIAEGGWQLYQRK